MGAKTLIVFLLGTSAVWCYLPQDVGLEKDRYLTDAFLRDVVERMGKELNDAASSYFEMPPNPEGERRLALMARASKDLENEQLDYDALLDGNPNPSLRDQEYIHHSSLWGNQYMAGGAGEGGQRLTPSGRLPAPAAVKTDAVLPAYCNPPNPCPVGYTEDQGCISQFENSAAFSREYQSAQRCMCDGEHMFDCSEQEPIDVDSLLSLSASQHKNLVAKKFHPFDNKNPYLAGEKLPIAAKKGINVYNK